MTMMSLYHLFQNGSWKDYQKMYDLFNTTNKDGEILDNEFCEKMLNYTDIQINYNLILKMLNPTIKLVCVLRQFLESRSLDKNIKL